MLKVTNQINMKIVAVLFIFLIQTNNSFCRNKNNDTEKKLPNGIRLGYQSSNFENNYATTVDNEQAFYVGYLRKVKLFPFLRLETGMEYMIAGAKLTQDSILKLNYIVLPAQLAFKVGPLFALGGVNANLKIFEKLTLDGEKVDISVEAKSTVLDVTVDAGAGINFLFLSLEARYYWGLTDIQDGWHNRYFQLGLRVNF